MDETTYTYAQSNDTRFYVSGATKFIEMPERSDWVCYLFGASEGNGLMYRPTKEDEPNFFVRWMMRVTLGCRWVKKP